MITISPNSPDALNQVLDRARERGALVLAVNGDLVDNYDHRDAAILPVDFTKTGPGQVELLGSMIGYEGEIAILSATTDAPDQNTWIAAMEDSLANDPKYAKMKLVATVYGDDEPQKSTTEAEALLQSYPEPQGHHLADHRRRRRRGAGDPVRRQGRYGQADRPRHAEPDAALHQGRHGRGDAALEPLQRGLARRAFRGRREERHDQERGRRDASRCPNLGTITIGENNVMNTQAELTTFDATNIDDFDF